MKVLVVDDDFELRSLVAFALRQGGFLVVEVADAAAALATARAEMPALVILDLNLPGRDGLDLLPELRAILPAPVLVLSVRSAEEDVVRALDLGADDFLTKPFSPRTLLARIRALLRRSGVERPEPLVAGDLELDLERRTARFADREPIRMTPLELRLLQLLVASANETVSVERLLSHIWGTRGAGDRQLLKQLVHRLRQKIEPDPAGPRYILTAAGEGYRFVPQTPGQVF
ncbi:MAG: response regulator transcription factor [Thermoanaerobaculia bacterium]